MTIGRVLALGALLLLTSCGGDGATPPADCTDPVAATRVELADFAFRPDCVSVDTGSTIELENTGDAPHTFTMAGTDLDVKLDPATSDEVTFGTVDPGTYSVTCTFHPQMEATLIVA
jgi:plastocyanin